MGNEDMIKLPAAGRQCRLDRGGVGRVYRGCFSRFWGVQEDAIVICQAGDENGFESGHVCSLVALSEYVKALPPDTTDKPDGAHERLFLQRRIEYTSGATGSASQDVILSV